MGTSVISSKLEEKNRSNPSSIPITPNNKDAQAHTQRVSDVILYQEIVLTLKNNNNITHNVFRRVYEASIVDDIIPHAG